MLDQDSNIGVSILLRAVSISEHDYPCQLPLYIHHWRLLLSSHQLQCCVYSIYTTIFNILGTNSNGIFHNTLTIPFFVYFLCTVRLDTGLVLNSLKCGEISWSGRFLYIFITNPSLCESRSVSQDGRSVLYWFFYNSSAFLTP